ncbi:uncharacterized protein A1O5_12393 [Cladophialophora psammophila CBS 110553]|uniref:Uncharacterized protein n=1 Tax=Cladophialophora psammophila CBS 110553 TaxID=1182543 RepID=W9VYR8_9EURO|nr:uncharacterized protein A1O5_12393 [Cladophialophora psammophila CBS 110553]EXJ57835.1 hypothetical protein A1O5_12393 [Cladophialophora psammophila CBS 110553]
MRQVISLNGAHLKQWDPNDDNPEVLELPLLPRDQVRMGFSIDGKIKQYIESDEHNPCIWDVANSRILNVYAALNIPIFETYHDSLASHISGAFEAVKTVGSIEADNAVKDKNLEPHTPFPLESNFMDDWDSKDSHANCDAKRLRLLADARVIMLEIDKTIPPFRGATEESPPSEDEVTSEDDSNVGATADNVMSARIGKKVAKDVSGNNGKRKQISIWDLERRSATTSGN